MFQVFSGVSGVSGDSGDSLKKPDLAYGSKNREKKVKIFLSDFQWVIKKCEIFLSKYFAGIEKSYNFALAFQG